MVCYYVVEKERECFVGHVSEDWRPLGRDEGHVELRDFFLVSFSIPIPSGDVSVQLVMLDPASGGFVVNEVDIEIKDCPYTPFNGFLASVDVLVIVRKVMHPVGVEEIFADFDGQFRKRGYPCGKKGIVQEFVYEYESVVAVFVEFLYFSIGIASILMEVSECTCPICMVEDDELPRSGEVVPIDKVMLIC